MDPSTLPFYVFKYLTLAIGSYEPRSYLSHQHMDPREACRVHNEIRARHSLGVHWGTFMMSDEHYMDPKIDFEKARVEYELEEGSVFTKNFGETFKIFKK